LSRNNKLVLYTDKTPGKARQSLSFHQLLSVLTLLRVLGDCIHIQLSTYKWRHLNSVWWTIWRLLLLLL